MSAVSILWLFLFVSVSTLFYAQHKAAGFARCQSPEENTSNNNLPTSPWKLVTSVFWLVLLWLNPRLHFQSFPITNMNRRREMMLADVTTMGAE